MINIGGKFYSNISTKYRDITSHETSANGWSMDGRKTYVSTA